MNKTTMKLLQGDCLEQMKTLPDNSVDAIVTDPPYGISFMAKKWDYDVPKVEVWREAMRVLKPGGHALIACGTRTQHRMVCNIEDAGFEIRDVVSWIYGQGFPKSLNVSKAIDKAAGAEREVVGVDHRARARANKNTTSDKMPSYDKPREAQAEAVITAPATEAAKQWEGWGTALKPACEFFTLARKPLSEKTVAANVLKWGTGGINIDGCRVGTDESLQRVSGGSDNAVGEWGLKGKHTSPQPQGRFPANLIHDGSQEVMDLFPDTKPSKVQPRNQAPREAKSKGAEKARTGVMGHNDNGGSAARFFYCPKASKKDRDEGLEGFEETSRKQFASSGRTMVHGEWIETNSEPLPRKNTHPTVKPTALMAYLCRLITPPGGTVLDPYMGSGSTGKAAVSEGFDFIGCELDEEYYKIATARINQQQ